MTRYLPIADHGLIGDLHTAALVGIDGTIDWYCCPRFDSPSVFGAILDAEEGGHWKLAPAASGWTTKQLYFPDTNVLITRFLTPDGIAEVIDFMPIMNDDNSSDHPHCLMRMVSGIRGELEFTMDVQPRFDYGRAHHELALDGNVALFDAPGIKASLISTVALAGSGRGAQADFVVREGQKQAFMFDAVGERDRMSFNEVVADEAMRETVAFWKRWLSKSRYQGRWRETVHRSALTLKLLTYEPTGALVAAPTMSLPETIGGGRNWDYRYTWIRDAAFSLFGLLRLGFTEEAARFMGWLTERFRGEADYGAGGPLQLMYRIDGSTDLPEEILDHWEGYRGSGPVRVGNGAADQLQLDIYGELIDSVYLYNKYGAPISHRSWLELSKVIEWLCANWDQPDEGIWETRGGRQNFTYSRLMSWVAMERAVRMALKRGLPADLVSWSRTRDEIYHQIMQRGWNQERKAFVQHYDTDVLDASVLLMPLVKFIAPADPLWISTLDAIANELVSDSLVYRYNPSASPDGLQGNEGTFSMCSFWYVEAQARAGRLEEARLAFEKMLTYANHLGLYSEEIGPTGEQLGNFPQAFTHLGLISAAFTLDRALG